MGITPRHFAARDLRGAVSGPSSPQRAQPARPEQANLVVMMNAPPPKPPRSIATPLVILSFGAVQVGIIAALLVIESPVQRLALRASESWPGRLALAAVGLTIINVLMIEIGRAHV